MDEEIGNSSDFDEEDEYFFTPEKVISLGSLCLNSIALNFQRINEVFLFSLDSAWRRNLNFLQKTHSRELLQLVADKSRDRRIRKEYMKFFLNKYLEEFKLALFEHENCPSFIELIKDVGHSFSAVDLTQFQSHLSPNIFIEIIHHSPNIEKLILPSDVNNEMIYSISITCKKLRVIEGPDCVFMRLKESLQMLLKNCTFLEEFRSSDFTRLLYDIHKRDFEKGFLGCTTKYNFISLDFKYFWTESGMVSYVDNEALMESLALCAELCPFAKNIAVSVTLQKHVGMLSLFENLQSLYVKNLDEDQKINMDEFIELKGQQLVELTVKSCYLSISVLSQNCTRLKRLYLKNVIFNVNKKVCHLQELEELSLCFDMESPNDEALRLLMLSTSKLKKIQLRELPFKDEIRASFINACSNNHLEEIYLEELSGVTIEFLQSVLLTLSRGAKLTLSYCSPIKRMQVSTTKDLNNEVEISYAGSSIFSNKPDVGELFENYVYSLSS